MIRPLRWHGDRLEILDQRALPHREVWLACWAENDVAAAIREMAIRGAPAIGVAAAYGAALAARDQVGWGSAGCEADPGADGAHASGAAAVVERVERASHLLAATRPTAVNLFWALGRVVEAARRAGGAAVVSRCAGSRGAGQAGTTAPGVEAPTAAAVVQAVLDEAQRIEDEDIAANRAIGTLGSQALAGAKNVYTHCNTGGLATAGYGTALGVIRSLWAADRTVHVFAGETRPYLQGARLTAWELQREGIPYTLCADVAAGHLMRAGRVDAVITGADRIAANGDVANKIGTYCLAVLAREQGLPFWVAAPLSTVDLELPDGAAIPLEERDAGEILGFAGSPVAPPGARAVNPAFDITPADLVAGIITEAGIARPPYRETLRGLKAGDGIPANPKGGGATGA